MIIELVGLPASGKSVLARRLKDEFHGQISTERPLKMMDGIVGIIRFPLIATSLLLHALRTREPYDTWYLVKYIVVARIAELGRALRNERRILQILDEGPLQALLSVSDTINIRSAKRMLRRTPAKLIVLFLTDEAERRERLRARTYKLRPHLTDTERSAWEERLVIQFKKLATCIEGDARTRVVRNEYDFEQLIGYINKLDRHA